MPRRSKQEAAEIRRRAKANGISILTKTGNKRSLVFLVKKLAEINRESSRNRITTKSRKRRIVVPKRRKRTVVVKRKKRTVIVPKRRKRTVTVARRKRRTVVVPKRKKRVQRVRKCVDQEKIREMAHDLGINKTDTNGKTRSISQLKALIKTRKTQIRTLTEPKTAGERQIRMMGLLFRRKYGPNSI